MNSPTKEQILKTLKEAQNAFVKQDYQAALEKYQWVEKHIQDDPENLPIIWIEIGWSYYLLQDFIPAIQFLQKAIKYPQLNKKQLFDCLRLIGFSYEYSGNTDKAIAYLQDAVSRKVEDDLKRYVYFELGKIFFARNLTKEAKPYLEKAQTLFTGEDSEYKQTTIYYLGFIAFFEGENTNAELLFREYIQQAPNPKAQAPGVFGLAHIFYDRKEYDVLLDVCNKIIHLDPDFYDRETLGYFLCRAYMELQMWDELEVFLDNLMQTHPEGRYKDAYPQLKWAMKNRKLPPREEKI
jgi:tetratricopeptide (TPR) repeat protein